MQFRVALVALGFVGFAVFVGCGEEEKFNKPVPVQPEDPAPLVTDSCTDGVKNQDESDADCGGAICSARCAEGQMCSVDSDCTGHMCDNGHCLTIPPSPGVFTVRCQPAAYSPSDRPCIVRVDHPSLPGDGFGPGYSIQPQVTISAKTLCTTQMHREELEEVLYFTGRVWNLSSSTYEWDDGYAELVDPNDRLVQRTMAAPPHNRQATSTREWLNCRGLGYPQATLPAP